MEIKNPYLKQKMRNCIDEVCFTCLVKVTFQTITSFEKTKQNGYSIYTREVANHNRDVIFKLAHSGDCNPVRTKFFNFWWTLGENMTSEKGEEVVFKFSIDLLERMTKFCIKDHLKSLNQTIPIEEINVLKMGDSRIQTEIEVKNFLKNVEHGIPRLLDSIDFDITNMKKDPNNKGTYEFLVHEVCMPFLKPILESKGFSVLLLEDKNLYPNIKMILSRKDEAEGLQGLVLDRKDNVSVRIINDTPSVHLEGVTLRPSLGEATKDGKWILD